jgi:2-polyprenyl-3-methyl-5-hydroxy-6-metoxy-1,4-benzoquinol methylase
MDRRTKAEIVERYSSRLAQHGPTAESMATGNAARRQIRYQILADVHPLEHMSILDVGCGLAYFADYLLSKNINFDYTGFDITPGFVSECAAKYPQFHFEVRDLEEAPPDENSYDVVVCSQVFNNRYRNVDNVEVVQNMLTIMHRAASKAVACDMMTSYVDFKEDRLFYYNPADMLSIAKSITKRVCLRHDYPLFEFCLYLYPDFEGWSSR